ncbi:MAG: hypothetical protein MR902_06000 [Campylobacter sp.]|nr:hypothetical protein [Campylobacter sp.]
MAKKKTVIITSYVMSDLERLIDNFIIIKRGGKVFQSDIKTFMNEYKIYQIPKNLEFDKDEFTNIDEYKNYFLGGSFSQKSEFKLLENATFEDKFLNFTGRYE